ncbi:alcohol dehydrogenase [Mesobacillus persicus]|uniref:Alcohol dehydrogenase n=1 Tax=Mesobacillus persicus TaxID=930146 RepID=A0A1H7VZA2_9BACI|nr:iron-containing alcohol dehydrogenase [Mesobacillus persicus]SEM14135.1 alcohol dehydrogenase [Mesobacillus persicus]
MENFALLRSPQTIIYGRNSFDQSGTEASLLGKNALIISDKIMKNLGYVDRCETMLKSQGVNFSIYLGVESEPTDQYVSEAMSVFVQAGCDLIISIGGGSCIDTAKAVSILATNGGSIGDYIGQRKVAKVKPIPHIAIPTTAGTGSEATDVTIITDTVTDIKMMIKQPALMPAVAIVDPLLTVSSPQHVTAATGVDALSHAIEAYISQKSHPMTDTLALSAMKLIVNNLVSAYEDGENLDAREAMSLGSMQAGMAFSNASVCLVHGMSRPIGALFHVPHGYSNAMLLPAVLEFSQNSCIERLADVGRIFDPKLEQESDEVASLSAVSAVKKLCQTLNIPNLRGWGINKEQFDKAVSKMAIDALASGSPGNNPRVPTQEEIEELYDICYSYNFNGPAIVN